MTMLTTAAGVTRDRLSWDRATVVLIVLVAALVSCTFRDYGVTWDEDVHTWYGVFALDYYLSFFSDDRALRWLNLYNYGAAFDMVAAAFNELSPLGTYETRHLLNAAVGLFGFYGCWKLGRVLGGPRAGFLAALFLALTPNYYGQMFNNPKDVPFAVASVWAIYYMVRIIPRLPAPPLRLVVKLGIAIGLGLGVRVGGLLFLCYLGLLIGLFVAWRLAETRSLAIAFDAAWRSVCRVLAPAVLVAYPVMLLFWPWAQQHPVENPLRALAFFTHETFPFRTLFDGLYVPASDLPWSYLPTYIVLALPELVLLLLVAAPVLAVMLLRRVPAPALRTTVLRHFMVVFGIVFPVAYAIAVKAVLFDGMRHFIFVLPLIAVAAALVADRLIERLGRFEYRRPVYGALALYGLAHVAVMAMLHPDQYVYYNGFVGGVEGAAGRFKMDYWANSYAEAVDGLENYLRNQYGADFQDHDFTVAVCGPPISADYFFPKSFVYSEDRQNADFFIAFTKDDCHKSLPGKEVVRVERAGALLSVVLDRREINAARLRPTPDTYAHSRVGNFAIGSELE
jgi:Dolichyl-phosphate-mannose-protein mannosyltransferase